jgi:hypothetical protein
LGQFVTSHAEQRRLWLSRAAHLRSRAAHKNFIGWLQKWLLYLSTRNADSTPISQTTRLSLRPHRVLWAQGTATASLSGTLRDATEGLIPDASVILKNVRTSIRRETTSNRAGTFVLPFLPPGDYTLRAEHAGFRPLEIPDVHVEVGDQLAVHLKLEVAATSEAVTVPANGAVIQESGTSDRCEPDVH